MIDEISKKYKGLFPKAYEVGFNHGGKAFDKVVSKPAAERQMNKERRKYNKQNVSEGTAYMCGFFDGWVHAEETDITIN